MGTLWGSWAKRAGDQASVGFALVSGEPLQKAAELRTPSSRQALHAAGGLGTGRGVPASLPADESLPL